MVAGCRFVFRSACSLTSETVSAMRPGGPGNQYYTVDQLSFGLAAVLAVESFDASGGIHQLLLARKKRMTTGTYLEPYLGLR
jgi:hypothetical protein